MATAQEPKTASELRQEMWAAHNRFSDLTAELIRLKESEPGSARHLQVLDEHLLAKREVDNLKTQLDKKQNEQFNNGIAAGVGLTPHGQTVLWMMGIFFVIAVFALWESFQNLFQIYKVFEAIIKAALTG
jgi:hypothetical protein